MGSVRLTFGSWEGLMEEAPRMEEPYRMEKSQASTH